MSIEQFEAEMASAGYNEEQIAEVKVKIQEWAQTLAQALEEVIAKFREVMASVFGEVKEVFKELIDMFKETLDEVSPNTKSMRPSKRLQCVNVNKVTNRVVKNYYSRDIRSMNMRLTRYRQKR